MTNRDKLTKLLERADEQGWKNDTGIAIEKLAEAILGNTRPPLSLTELLFGENLPFLWHLLNGQKRQFQVILAAQNMVVMNDDERVDYLFKELFGHRADEVNPSISGENVI